MPEKNIIPEDSPINGLAYAPEWAGTNVFLACEPVSDRSADLHVSEQVFIEKSVQLRRNTFSSGRACARTALARAGIEPEPLLRMDDGSIQWPSNVIGSITHTDYWAVAAIGVTALCEARAIGIDLEPVRVMDSGVIELIANSEEQAEIVDQSAATWHATALFSLKESIYKCLRPSFGRFIEFHDVQIHDLASGKPSAHFMSAELHRRFDEKLLELRMAVTHDHVFTLAWLRQ